MKGLQISEKEKQLIIESLLFTSNVDVCSEHTDRHRAEMLDLAEKINDKNIKLHNIFLFKTDVYEEESSKTLLERFPNIATQDIITD
jgi:hypothetical protein